MPATPIVAILDGLQLHTPPLTRSESMVVAVGHTVNVPMIVPALGNGSTVTTDVAATVPQLLVTVYEMVAVPGATPFKTPELLTVAMPGFMLLQTPPGAVSVSAVVLPWQNVKMPVITPAKGDGLTVSIEVIKQPVGSV